MNPHVDTYFIEGCGRCELYQTPHCKVHDFNDPMQYLRGVLLETALKEDYKWSQPCYTLKGKNVLILTAFKDYCCLSFFKGSLMKDVYGIMKTPGQNSQAVKQLRYTSLPQVKAQEKIIKEYLHEAIELEKLGAKVAYKQKNELNFPKELFSIMEDDPVFRKSFSMLTPGRQRSWNLHFSSAKQSSTRTTRIEKAKQKIGEGKGWNER